MRYTIYVNRNFGYANIHRTDCRHVGIGGGVSRVYPPTGWYIGEFSELRGALYVARRIGQHVQRCTTCLD